MRPNRARTAAGSARVTGQHGESGNRCCCGAAGTTCLSTVNVRPETAASKRQACAFTHSAKRVCGGGFDGEDEASTRSRWSSVTGGGSLWVDAAQRASPPGDGEAQTKVTRNGCGTGTARGRVRLYRVRSFLSAGAITCHHQNEASGAGPVPDVRSGPSRVKGGPPAERDRSRCGSAAAVVEKAQCEAERRQAALEERTYRLRRRLQTVQVKQVQRHVAQQLSGLRQRSPGCRRGALELGRLVTSCGEVLRSAEEALDSDHTASSSGGSSDSEKDEEEEEVEEGGRGRRRVGPAAGKTVCTSMEWQWTRERAWLGSRWVWLQAQVSELEYRIRALSELYTHLKQGKVGATHSIPETPLRAPRPPRGPPDCRTSSVSDSLRNKQVEDSAHSTQTPPTQPSSAARVRPLLRRQNHRLIRIDRCAALGSKAVRLAAPEPRTGLDPSAHPVLSMSSDCPLALYCGTPPLAGPLSHSGVQWRGRGQGPQRAGRGRRRLVCPRPPNTLPPKLNTAGGFDCRSPRGVFSPGFLPQRASDTPPLPATPPDTPTQPLRRRRGESSFDIDNLVMPLGLAGLGARVQKLQYKEILTPSWRELDSVCGVSAVQVDACRHLENHRNTPQQPSVEGAGDKVEVEDLSDAVFLKRHAVCESRERSRWGSWARRRCRGGSSSSCLGEGKSSRGSQQEPSSPGPRPRLFTGGDTSPCSPLRSSGADDPFYHSKDEQQAVQPWERRLFPLLEAELRWLQDEEEAEFEEDVCAASARSQSTDSGISVGSLELSPRTPQPHQQHLDTELTCPQMLTCKSAVQSTQDSASLLLCLAPPPSLSSSASPRAQTITHHSNHRASRTSASPI